MSIFFQFNSTIFYWLSAANYQYEYKRKMCFVLRIHVIDSRTYVKSKELLRVSGKALLLCKLRTGQSWLFAFYWSAGNSQNQPQYRFDFLPAEKFCLKLGVCCQNKNDDWSLQELKNSVARTTFYRLKKTNKKIHPHLPCFLGAENAASITFIKSSQFL